MSVSIGSIRHRALFLSIACTFIFSITLYSQEKRRIQSRGISISKEKSPEDALEDALNDAKKNALLKAGIPENLFVSNLLYEFGDKRNVSTYFHGISNTELGADILIDKIISENRSFDQYGNMVVSVDIEAVVYLYDETADPGLFMHIEGLKDVYYENEFISFSMTPSQNGYLTIFAFNEDESFVLYPFVNKEYTYLSDENERLFEKGQTELFPLIEAYRPGYTIEMNNRLKDESALLLFVFTKEHIPWLKEEVTLESVRSWVYQIPMRERELVYRNILLKQVD